MSESAKVDEGQQSSGEGQKESVNLEELAARLKQLESTNERLLDENKKIKSKYKETTSLFENAEREKLEKEGNYQGLLESEKKRSATLEESLKEMRNKVLKSNLDVALSKYSNEVHDLEDLRTQPRFQNILLDAIDSENLAIREEKVKEYVNEVFKAKPWIKKEATIPATVTSRPNMAKVADKSLNELSSKDIEELLKNGNFN